MEKMKMTVCPVCGWTVKSPFGEDDIIKHVKLHAEGHHPEMKNAKREDIVKMIKEV